MTEVLPETPERPHRAWPVYAVTLAIVPATIWLVAAFGALIALAVALLKVIRGEIALGAIGIDAQSTLTELFGEGVRALLISILANSVVFGSVALIAAAIGLVNGGRRRGEAWARLRLDRADPKDMVIATVGLLGLTGALDATVDLLSLREVGRLADLRALIAGLGVEQRIGLSLVLGFGAGAAEELYFRGYMLTKLELAQGRVTAVIVTALVFGLFHWDPVHTPLAAMMGLYLGVCVLITHSLWASIAAHVVNNVTATMMVDLVMSDESLVFVLILGLAVAVLAIIALERRHRGEPRRPVW